MNTIKSRTYPLTELAGNGVARSEALRLTVVPRKAARPETSLLKTLPVLFKLRIVTLLLFAAVGGAFLAAGGRPGIGELSLLLITGGLAAAGASALNQYLEKDSDALMTRTRKRLSGGRTKLAPRPTMMALPCRAMVPITRISMRENSSGHR